MLGHPDAVHLGGLDGLGALRRAVLEVLDVRFGPLLAEAGGPGPVTVGGGARHGGRDDGTPPPADGPERDRLVALVELARGGDAEAFGLLFDHYHRAVHRFLLRRTGSVTLAEDLTSETFFRALRSIQDFRWQGRDFGAWLMTIARNLAHDHLKSARSRLETTTDDLGPHEAAMGRAGAGPGTEETVLARLTHEVLLQSLRTLPVDQRDCLVLRFLQGMSLAEVAEVLERSTGAVKQLQLRALRTLADRLPEGVVEP